MLHLKTLSELNKYRNGEKLAFIQEEVSEPFFYMDEDTPKVVDGGIVVADGLGRKWIRHWNQANGVNPWWWHTLCQDFKKDCILALEAMVKFCTIPMGYGNPEEHTWLPLMNFANGGIYKVSRPWIIGGVPCNPEDAMKLDWYKPELPSYNHDQHMIMSGQLPISLKFNQRAYIWGDFKPKELTAVVSIGSNGSAYGGWDVQNASIEGLKVCGWDGMDMRKHGRDSNQVGLMQYGGNHIHMINCGFYNCEVGLIQNAAYFDDLIQMRFGNCGKGYVTQGCHATNGFMMQASYCDTAFEIRSGAATFKGMNTEECKKALIIANPYCHFDGLYFEKSNTEPDDTENYQIQIGYDRGEDARGDSLVRVTTITAATISGGINGIILKPTAGQLDIGGSTFVSTKVTMTDAGNRIITRNNYGDINDPGPGQISVVY